MKKEQGIKDDTDVSSPGDWRENATTDKQRDTALRGNTMTLKFEIERDVHPVHCWIYGKEAKEGRMGWK